MPTLPLIAPTRRPARRQRFVAALVAAGIGTLAGTLVVPASGAAAPLQARPAAGFRDSIGVQTHFPFTGYAYDTASTSDLAGMLRTLGVSHLRDDLCFNTEAACQRVRSRIAAMQDALGPGAPRVDLMAGYTRELAAIPGRAARDADIERALTAATSSPLSSMLAGLEPVNEPDLKGTTGWESSTLADDDTFTRLLAQPRFAALRGIPHLSPAIGHASNTTALLASGWSKTRADVGNFHPYPAAWGGPENALGTACGATDALSCAGELGQSAAPIATESGYSTSGTPLSTNWVSERAQAIYLPRLLLENYRRGIARTYLYELIDLKPQRGSAVDGYGLWRARAAGTTFVAGDPKPAALAVSRMNATIGDLGAPSATSSLDVTLQSSGKVLGDDDVRRVLLQRADGSYVLALWQPKAVWDNTVFKQSDRSVADLGVDVTISGATWNATATRPSVGDAATGHWDDAQRFTVPVGADVTLIDLRKVGDAAPLAIPEAAPAAIAAAAPAALPAARSAQTTSWLALWKSLGAALTQASRQHSLSDDTRPTTKRPHKTGRRQARARRNAARR